jgi:replication-associated recombination protein RarA
MGLCLFFGFGSRGGIMASLFERHRPQSFEDVVGQDKAVATLRRLKPGARAFYLCGPSGSGKTTLARIVAHAFAESWHVDEIDAADCTMDYLRGMEAAFAYRGMGDKQGKAWIVNEAHALRGQVLTRFLTLIEQLPDHCTILFTTSKGRQVMLEGFDDADPFLSRCSVVEMAVETAKTPFVKDAGPLTRKLAEHVRTIAQAEGLDGRPIEEYIGLALKRKNNVRAMLSDVDAGCMAKD